MNYKEFGKQLIKLSNDILFATYEMKKALEELNDACDKHIEPDLEYDIHGEVIDLKLEERAELENNLGCDTNEMFNLKDNK